MTFTGSLNSIDVYYNSRKLEGPATGASGHQSVLLGTAGTDHMKYVAKGRLQRINSHPTNAIPRKYLIIRRVLNVPEIQPMCIGTE